MPRDEHKNSPHQVATILAIATLIEAVAKLLVAIQGFMPG